MSVGSKDLDKNALSSHTVSIGNGGKARSSESESYLDKNVKITGKLVFDGMIRIDGQIEGEIVGNSGVLVGESAALTAHIRAATVIIEGRVRGDISATQRIELSPTARVIGKMSSPCLLIQEGAHFEGQCLMKLDSPQLQNQQHQKDDQRAASVFMSNVHPAKASEASQSGSGMNNAASSTGNLVNTLPPGMTMPPLVESASLRSAVSFPPPPDAFPIPTTLKKAS